MIKKVLIFETDYIFRKDLRQKITLCNYSDKIEVFFQDSVDNIEEVIEEEGIDELVINAALLDDISTTDFNGIKIRAYAKNLSGFEKIIESGIESYGITKMASILLEKISSDDTVEGEEEDMDPCSCSTYVNATIKKGLKTWEGSLPVNISLKPVKIESGTMIKEPADERTSSLTVTPSSEYNTYIYLESKTKKANDMSFIVKKGEETTVSVPLDKYIMYWANGDTWYGGDYLFGPQTTYQKDPEEWDFSNYTWSFKLETTDGNLSGETVEEDEFPEL